MDGLLTTIFDDGDGSPPHEESHLPAEPTYTEDGGDGGDQSGDSLPPPQFDYAGQDGSTISDPAEGV